MAITAHAAQHTGGMRTKRRTVRATMRRQRGDTGIMIRIPDLDRAVPRGRKESILGH